MRNRLFILSLILFVLALGASGVLADARINQAHHFGGDVLYCNHEDGCWMVNMHGEPLWEVAQSVIEDAVQAACDTGENQVIEAGQGTYGPSTLVVGCPDSITLTGYDEWDKYNEMRFSTDYLPVNPAPSGDSGKCSVDLKAHEFVSVDRIHKGVGFDIWSTNDDLEPVEFLHWSATDEGHPACDIEIRRAD